ncbi:hypothetical protein BDN70DRAFT_869824 [Pholiota conissans]|uniref:N-acetyltransferase domain-containing protein n=1 Tax=Pholiota conissans TaxID=109636 RepID=A0A9P5ZE09_9AGAR|nr:hypothetical protein BDN70DRAFT_869824 [Pholiota conissans]
MANPQLYPLEVNATTKEPFLRLRNHKNIILTPPRHDDEDALIAALNDFAIADCLSGPPYPYTRDHARQYIDKINLESQTILKQLDDAKSLPDLIVPDNCPVRYLREVKENGSEVFIGDLGMMRCMHGELMGPDGVDWENKKKLEEENNDIPVGDPRIIWSIGDFLVTSHHRQGIMTDAVQTVLHEWAIPRMKVRHMWVSAYTSNDGSVKVFLKNGFKIIKTIENHHEAKGKMRGLHLMEWRYE